MSWIPFAVVAGLLVVVAWAGIVSTDIGPWYRDLNKPSWQPPDWAFGPVWTTIYCFIIASLGLAWNAAPADTQLSIVVVVGINFVLNILWSWLFFKQRRPRVALVEVVFLWGSIVAMMVVIYPVHGLAAWLLLPYIVWVSVAAYLNLTIVRLNPDVR